MKIKKSKIIIGLVFITGISLILYPTVSNWWNSMHQTRAIGSYTKEVKDLSKEEDKKLIEQARKYNEKLLGESNDRFSLNKEEYKEYNSILNIGGNGIIGVLNIPKIKVDLPIYHGIDNSVLEVAVGHIPGSSFPVGGKGTHCVLAGHRGLPSAKLFTDLDQLKIGDTFTIEVLDKTLTYQVDQIRIVLPKNLSNLKIDKNEDYVTLQTCTPYGINTHRLLVRGKRVDNSTSINVTSDAVQVDSIIITLIVLATIIFIIFLGYIVKKILKK